MFYYDHHVYIHVYQYIYQIWFQFPFILMQLVYNIADLYQSTESAAKINKYVQSTHVKKPRKASIS